MRLGLVVVLVACAGVAVGAPRKSRHKRRPHTAHTSHPKSTQAKSSTSRFSMPTDAVDAPAYRYGMMSAATCEAELTSRKIPFVREAATRGVRAPVRLTGPLHGVEFRTNLRERARASTPWEIGDCRLVLALDDFARILERHEVIGVRHYSMYRLPAESWPSDTEATRHNGALAIDAARFLLKDGSYLDVLDHFHGKIGDRTCGERAAPHPATAEAKELRAILCETVAARLFNVVLTPNYNRPHKNHFHLEVTSGVKWFLVH